MAHAGPDASDERLDGLGLIARRLEIVYHFEHAL
jgi:hypothetical protein